MPQRISNPNGGHVPGAPAPVDPVGTGDPIMDAIQGNEIQVWGLENAPPPKATLKTCNDGGIEALFEASDEVARGEVSTEPAVFSAGAQFAHEESFSQPSTIRELDTEEVGPEEAGKQKLKQMDEELRQKSLEPFEGPGFYIPINSLHSVMTRDAIRIVLPYIAKNVRPDSLFDQLAQDIYGRKEENQRTAKSYRKILAVLVLIGKADTIVDFVRAGVTDAQLPLKKLGYVRPFQLAISDSEEPLRLFRKWEHRDIEEFESKQWETLAPFFSTEAKGKDRVRYKLSWRHPLPFKIIPDGTDISAGRSRTTSGGTSGSEASSPDSMQGGHGKVWKVEIHEAHHSLQSYRVRHLLLSFSNQHCSADQIQGNEENPQLAIKRLLVADKEDFKNEVDILTRLNKCNDPHLVKLLLTMEISGRFGKDSNFFLIFPLADGNLRQFWQRNFPHQQGTNTATYPRWVANQFHGLARALCKLHDLHEREVVSLNEEEDDKKSSAGDPFYGIHGDIKPENLLWYKEWVGPGGAHALGNENATEVNPGTPDSKDPFGVLQLADFGISRLHHTETRSNTNMRRSTKTYAPPEVEWAIGDCSRSFDIWGLGCVFLEFVCWLVQSGPEKTNPVDIFHDARYLEKDGRKTNTSLEGTIQDTFYHVVRKKHTTTFEVNPAVEKVR